MIVYYNDRITVVQITEDKLKEKFSEKGVVTDVQLKYTKDGKFRHFGFVGYQTKKEADAAIEYFDKSYFNSLRITVEPCSQLGMIIHSSRIEHFYQECNIFDLYSRRRKQAKSME